MGIRKGDSYDFSVWAKQVGEQGLTLKLELQTPTGEVIGKADLAIKNKDWSKQKVNLTASATEPKAKLVIWLDGKGAVDLDMISLFPQKTWKGRPGGLRPDLVQLLADMHPGFLRFPGGCIVEGRELATRYQWKKNHRQHRRPRTDRQSLEHRICPPTHAGLFPNLRPWLF